MYLFNRILNYKYKPSNVLYCGLVGFSGARPLDEVALKLLLLYNESRGKDSSGFYLYDPDKTVELSDRVIREKGAVSDHLLPLYSFSDSTCFIGHTRQATTGVVSQDNAHPFTLYNKDKSKVIIGAHNGTVGNYTDLMEKLGITKQDCPVDSMVIFKLILDYLDKGKTIADALSELAGEYYAILFTFDDDTLFVYRRSQRPLHSGAWVYNQGTPEEALALYISSMPESLDALGVGAISEFEQNILYEIKAGEVVKKTKIVSNPFIIKRTYTGTNSNIMNIRKREEDNNGIYIEFNRSSYLGHTTNPATIMEQVFSSANLARIHDLNDPDTEVDDDEVIQEAEFVEEFELRNNDTKMYDQLKLKYLDDLQEIKKNTQDALENLKTLEKSISPKSNPKTVSEQLLAIMTDLEACNASIGDRITYLNKSNV